MTAEKYIYKLQFSQRTETDDGYGNTVSDWHDEFEARCGITYLKGSEAVMAARLESRTPIIITIRNSSNARNITGDWRATDARTGAVYQIKENPRPTNDRSAWEMLAESGVAA